MYENAIMTANTNVVHFKSEALNAVTAEISGYITEVQTTAHANHIAISKALARVSVEKLYEEDGFKSALEYAMTTFGWKKANAYAMMQVGAKLNAGELPEGDFSVSQYREMLPLSKDAAQEAVDNGIITADMSAKDIRNEVQTMKPKAERKVKPEKSYAWLNPNNREQAIVTATESELAEGCTWVHKFKQDDEVFVAVRMENGKTHLLVRGNEVTEEATEEKAGE